MGITSANKTIEPEMISCDGTFKVTLALSASPDISSNPTDIALVLDRSGSMAGTPLAHLKTGTKAFIDIIEEATDGTKDGIIGGGSHIGIVSFSTTATVNEPLSTSVSDLKTAVDSLTAGGSTNHSDAFNKAAALFDPASTNAKVIVMFTDGKTTEGGDASPAAAAARAAGIVIYVIGLLGANGIDVDAINDWATDPDSSHVVITPDEEDLEKLFADLAADISKPGATKIVIDEKLNDDFEIVDISAPTKGTATKISSTELQWKIDALGVTANEGALLTFTVRHIGTDSGSKQVNKSVTYSDKEGNHVTFPDPHVDVDCEKNVVVTEPCPRPVSVTAEGCKDADLIDLGDTYLGSQGRIVQFNVTVKNVCRGKRVALAIVLTEVDRYGVEHPRGLKALTLPAHNFPGCRDVLVRCVKFVLPEDLDVSGETPQALCNPRNLKVRLIAHHIDSDFVCCDAVTKVSR